MQPSNIIAVILTSAAVGSLVSGVLAVLGQHWERKARKRQQILDMASRLAEWKSRDALDVAKHSGRAVDLLDPAVLVEAYYGWVDHLDKHGRLPDDPCIERNTNDPRTNR